MIKSLKSLYERFRGSGSSRLIALTSRISGCYVIVPDEQVAQIYIKEGVPKENIINTSLDVDFKTWGYAPKPYLLDNVMLDRIFNEYAKKSQEVSNLSNKLVKANDFISEVRSLIAGYDRYNRTETLNFKTYGERRL